MADELKLASLREWEKISQIEENTDRGGKIECVPRSTDGLAGDWEWGEEIKKGQKGRFSVF